MAAFLSTLTSIFTSLMSWVGDLVEYISSEPLILVPLLVFFIGGGVIGIVNRLIRG